jgi:hypothetical protein
LKTIFETAIEVYGRDAQLDMVIEEASELIKAILKLRRAERKNNESVDDLDSRTKEGQLVKKALEGGVVRAQKDLVEEWADLSIMLSQLRVMIPGEYRYTWEDKVKKLSWKLQNDAGLKLGVDYQL